MDSLASKLEQLTSAHDKRLRVAAHDIGNVNALLEKLGSTAATDDSLAGELIAAQKKMKSLKKLLNNETRNIRAPLNAPGNPNKIEAEQRKMSDEVRNQLRELNQHMLDCLNVAIIKESAHSVLGNANHVILRGLVPGMPINDQLKECQEAIVDLNKKMKSLNIIRPESNGSNATIKPDMLKDIEQQEKLIHAAIVKLESLEVTLASYKTPTAVKAICSVKLLELKSAQAAIPKDDKENAKILQFIDARVEHIETILANPDGHDGQALLGTPALAPLQAVFKPSVNKRQMALVHKTVKHIVERLKIADET